MVERVKASKDLCNKDLVRISVDKGTLKLRWNVNGKRYSFSPGLKDSPIHWKEAKRIANEIELDILSRNFDESLDKYRIKASSKSSKKEKEKDHPTFTHFLPLLEKWIEAVKPSERNWHHHYKPLKNWIAKGNPKIEALAEWLEKDSSLAPITWNQRVSKLRSCIQWGMKRGFLTTDVLADVKPRAVGKQVNPTRKPFTSEEIELIIQAFDSNQFCPKRSAFKHSHYFTFVRFLFYTGCRPAELIGLQWKHINWNKKEMEISSVLARSDSGSSNAKQRVRKETKTGSIRFFSLTEEMIELLKAIPGTHHPEALVFTSPKGNAIDDRTFLDRQWKTVVEGLKLEYRVPYACRHSMASRAIEQGIPLTGVAYLLGHRDTSMVVKHYGHMINRPALPSL